MTPEQAAAAPAAASVAADHPRSDLGNARRFVAAHGRNLRYVHGHGWFHWTGIVCQSDTDGVVTRLIADVTDQILAEAVVAPEDQRKAAVAFALSSQSARRIAAALELAAADSRSRPSPISSTPIPCLLAVANGTDDLRTGHCRPSRRADLLTRASTVQYDPAAKCPRWDRFLEELFPGDAARQDFVDRLLGYLLTGRTDEHDLAVLHGSGANGKSVLVQVTEGLLGDHAARPASTPSWPLASAGPPSTTLPDASACASSPPLRAVRDSASTSESSRT